MRARPDPTRPDLPRPDLPRRALLRAGLAAGAGTAAAGSARAILPASATLLVPGLGDGPLARLAERLAASLGRSATTALTLNYTVLGGPDGVTASNRFVTEGAPDGRTLLLLPGLAPLARMVGDPRARFDATGWLPVCALQASAVVAGRETAMPGRSGPLRFAFGAADMPGAAGLLALDLLGVAASPVPGLPSPRAEAALAQGAVEAALLHGADLPTRLAACGARPWFTLEPAGQRDPLLPEVPSLLDLPLGGPPELRGALAAATASLRLVAALVLPALTPANTVASWRLAAQRWLEGESRLGWPPGLRALPGAEAAPLAAAIAPPQAAMQAYRDWLAQRLSWRAD